MPKSKSQGLSDRAIALNQIADEYRGIESDRILDAVSGIGLSIIDKLLPEILQQSLELESESGTTEKNLSSLPLTLKLLGVLPGFMRECRSAAAQKEEIKYIKDKSNLVLSGAQRMADILTIAFKDTAYAEGVAEAIDGAMLQIELEVKGEGKK